MVETQIGNLLSSKKKAIAVVISFLRAFSCMQLAKYMNRLTSSRPPRPRPLERDRERPPRLDDPPPRPSGDLDRYRPREGDASREKER